MGNAYPTRIVNGQHMDPEELVKRG
ncbi:hypothetical protein [Ferroacidibacillus organovorans]